jgi:nifR3 family TIM-barrel protein
MCREGGADLAYTEMVSAAALAHGHNATRHLLETMAEEGPVACQIFGAKEEEVASTACLVSSLRAAGGGARFVELNLNAGCPMLKVTQCGAGAKLAEDPEKVYRLLKAMAENTPLPVTLKTRLGPHPRRTTVFELLDAAEQAGARGFILHARYTSQMHGGETHLDLLSEVVRRARIPVTGNGSVVDAKSAAAVAATGVDAVMVGRAALSRPAMFSALRGDAETSDARRPTGGESSCRLFEKHLGYILEFRRQLAERFPNDHIPSEDAFASVKMHVHLFRYFAGRPGAAALRARLNRVRSIAEMREAVDSLSL